MWLYVSLYVFILYFLYCTILGSQWAGPASELDRVNWTAQWTGPEFSKWSGPLRELDWNFQSEVDRILVLLLFSVHNLIMM